MARAALIWLVLCFSMVARAEDAPQTTGQKERGFVLEASLGSRLFDINNTGANGLTTVSFGALQGGLFTGYKVDRFMFGVGFDISRVATSNSQPGGDTSASDTVLLFVPGIRVAIVRSKDQRVEMFGQFDLGLGTSIHDGNGNTNGNLSYFNLSYVIGPGLRFWAHPQFAIGAVVGVRGDYEYVKDTETVLGTTTTTSQSTLLTSIFAALNLTGVF